MVNLLYLTAEDYYDDEIIIIMVMIMKRIFETPFNYLGSQSS